MGMEFKLIKEGDESPALKFKMPQWSHYIVITRDDGRDSDWKNLYIGISQSSLLGAKELPIRQLSCFQNVVIRTGLMDGNGFYTPIGIPPVATYQYA